MDSPFVSRSGQWIRAHAPDEYRPVVIAVELCLIVASNYLAFWLRFEGAIPAAEWDIFMRTVGWLLVVRALTFVPFGVYTGLWQYTGVVELAGVLFGVLASTVVFWRVVLWIEPAYSRSVVLIDAVVLVALLGGLRASKRIILQATRMWSKGGKRVLIFGAGDAGEMVVRDMQMKACGYEPIAFVDDDPKKRGQRIHGVPVLGSRTELVRLVKHTQPHEVLVAVPSANAATVRSIVETLRPLKVPITTLPTTKQILEGRVSVHEIRQLTIEDLLPRAAVDLDISPVRALIGGKRVLVTGAGGSIGSELSRQIAALGPSLLVLFERYENGLYTVTNDLLDRFGGPGIVPLIGDVTDAKRVHQVLEHWRPDIIFHAAAHKHVPLMEHNPCEAIKNNVVGTATIAKAAHRWGVERFILISTDKAVNPSSVMGATKRVGELILQVLARRSGTKFMTVRFGNVLGSSGSVVPRFLEQIRAGGPVTVTHPDMRRFFMLIPEAVQLVLHAAALGEPGTVYVLEMGEQVSLVEMARNLIRLAGFIPDEEIPIDFVGLRPGEKLYEELAGDGEAVDPSPVPKILRVRGGASFDAVQLESQIEALVEYAMRGDAREVIRQLRAILPTFEPTGEEPSAPPPAAAPAVTPRKRDAQRDERGRFATVH